MKSKLEQATKVLNEKNIDCWVILLREGKEKAVDLLLEKEFIGESAFIFTKNKRMAIVASYDKDRVRDMNVVPYEKGITDVLSDVLKKISPQKI